MFHHVNYCFNKPSALFSTSSYVVAANRECYLLDCYKIEWYQKPINQMTERFPAAWGKKFYLTYHKDKKWIMHWKN